MYPFLYNCLPIFLIPMAAASKLLQIPIKNSTHPSLHTNFLRQTTNLLLPSSFITEHCPNNQSRTIPSLLSSYPKCKCTKSSSSISPKPPTTKEEAILQAKLSLASTLEKPLNNLKLSTIGKIKKVKQLRLRVEIPVVDDSPSSLSKLARQVFGNMPLKKKGSPPIKILVLWPCPDSLQAADEVFSSSQSSDILVRNIGISSGVGTLPSSDMAVFMAPDASQLEIMKTVADSLNPKPVVIFNPKWRAEEEENLGDAYNGFIGSFDVVYSFTGLEVRGILSKRKGVVFKCVRDGVMSGEKWKIMVEEEGTGELRVVSSFRARPSMAEVENVLYNVMAANSPVTKSAKFLKDLVSNVTGKNK
ncbi:uncharacterized protein LOC127255004 [Andrographis paniculata]|uniref:uncharacterized protein LOC127255004 n=1 Tax=Andrographis paniculata TaxID=175694 RepID=UPI0021E755E5|nr:uncharacterized protein LOC127255004 [Andrographis paniculata]